MITVNRCGLMIPVMLMLTVNMSVAQNQPFYFGNDLSYVNQMEDCGADFKRFGESEEPFRIFADVGTNLVRVRLWIDPSWWQEPLVQPSGVKSFYSDFDDVKMTIERAKTNGMEVMLDLHYSDFWADPGRQLVPRAWVDIATDSDALADSVYAYTSHILKELDSVGLMPEIVKVGNENNGGIMTQIPQPAPSFSVSQTIASWNSWSRNAKMFNAGIRAVRDVGAVAAINPKIALHWSNLNGLESWYDNMLANGVTDFDIMGFSYYYSWHEGSIAQLESRVAHMAQKHPDYEIMVVETGYLWTTQYGGIINNPDPNYLPVIPEKQLEYMVDYTRAVKRAGGTGVIFWEPAWVNTSCRTPWITGSSHTGVAFFHPSEYNFMENGGGHWTQPRFYEDVDHNKVTIRVTATGLEVAEEGIYLDGNFIEDATGPVKMASLGGDVYSYFTFLPAGYEGSYFFINGSDPANREIVPEECALANETDRAFAMPGASFIIDSVFGECDDTVVHEEVNATFRVDMTGADQSRGVFITGNIVDWEIVQMDHIGDSLYEYSTRALVGDEGAYYYMTTSNWTNYLNFRESVPSECALWYGSDRGYIIPNEDVVFAYVWASCEEIEDTNTSIRNVTLPFDFRLLPNYPNPFNPTTQISFEVPEAGYVRILVFDVLGRLVRVVLDDQMHPGSHELTFDAHNLTSGIYLVRMYANNTVQTRKMTLLK